MSTTDGPTVATTSVKVEFRAAAVPEAASPLLAGACEALGDELVEELELEVEQAPSASSATDAATNQRICPPPLITSFLAGRRRTGGAGGGGAVESLLQLLLGVLRQRRLEHGAPVLAQSLDGL